MVERQQTEKGFKMPDMGAAPKASAWFFEGKRGKVVGTFLMLYFLFHIIYTLGWLTTTHINLTTDHFTFISVGGLCIFVFLMIPRKGGTNVRKRGVPWWDWLLMAGGIAGVIYNFTHIEQFFRHLPVDNVGIILGTIFIIVLLEALRRCMGLMITAVMLVFIFYAMFANYFPGVLWSTGASFTELIANIFAYEGGLFGDITRLFAELIVIFMLFATTIQVSGAGRALMKTALGLLGHTIGGAAKVSVIGSGLFGSVAPVGSANVMVTGSVTIPMMKSTGQTPEFAGAVEAVSSIMGGLTPPIMGAVAFIMADWLELPFYLVMFAAFLPSMLYFFTLFWMVHFQAKAKDIPAIPKEEMPSAWEGIKEGWYYLIPIALFVYWVAVVKWSPQLSILYAWFILVALGQIKKETRITPRRLFNALQLAIRMIVINGPMLVAIGIVLASLALTGMTIRLTGSLTLLCGDSQLLLLMLCAVASFVLGMGMPNLVAYFIVAALVAPALVQTGIMPIAAHLFTLYALSTFAFTPPVMPGVIFCSALAESNIWGTAWSAIRLAIAAYIVPFVFIYNPALLLQGGYSAWEVLFILVPSLLGCICLAAGIQGYFIKKANWLQRVILIGSGGALILSFTNLWVLLTSALTLVLLVAWWQGISPISELKRLLKKIAKKD